MGTQVHTALWLANIEDTDKAFMSHIAVTTNQKTKRQKDKHRCPAANSITKAACPCLVVVVEGRVSPQKNVCDYSHAPHVHGGVVLSADAGCRELPG